MISKSPNRHSFQKESYIKRMNESGETPSPEYLDMFDKILNEHATKFDDPSSRVDNMEYDLLSTNWILEKVRDDDAYAQNLYAAMCNNEFIKLDVIPILTEKKWSCSWRYAGGIIADMQQEGDYIDWYCSGIREVLQDNDRPEMQKEKTEEQVKQAAILEKYVTEGCITEEIRADLQKLGWAVASGGD